jgi:hypothetical protein
MTSRSARNRRAGADDLRDAFTRSGGGRTKRSWNYCHALNLLVSEIDSRYDKTHRGRNHDWYPLMARSLLLGLLSGPNELVARTQWKMIETGRERNRERPASSGRRCTMRQYRSITVLVTGLLLLGLVGCAADSMTSSSEPPPSSPIAQAQGEHAQPPSGAAQEPGTVQPPPGTDLPPSSTAGEPGPAAQDEPPAGDVQERGILPGVILPGVPADLPKLQIVGPTENITKVANAIQKSVKSVTQRVTVKEGLVLTQPVTISALLGGYCSQRITEKYVPWGNYLLHNDCEGDGKPRRAFAEITLTEPNPAGGVYVLPITGSDNLVPLYNVAMGKLTFLSEGACDLFNIPFPMPFGKQEFHFGWWSPDGIWREPPSFSLEFGGTRDFPEFRWAVQELSQVAIQNFRMPAMGFWEHDATGKGSVGAVPPYVPRSTEPVVVPHKSGDVIYIKMKDILGDSSCKASSYYKMDSVLLACVNYPYCEPLPGYHH